jgi:hypothetical protein
MKIGKYKIEYENWAYEEGYGFKWSGYWIITLWGAKPPHKFFKTFRLVPWRVNKIYQFGTAVKQYFGFNRHYTRLPVRWFFLKSYNYHKKYDYAKNHTLKWFITGYE